MGSTLDGTNGGNPALWGRGLRRGRPSVVGVALGGLQETEKNCRARRALGAFFWCVCEISPIECGRAAHTHAPRCTQLHTDGVANRAAQLSGSGSTKISDAIKRRSF
jgi:hypothetical protein